MNSNNKKGPDITISELPQTDIIELTSSTPAGYIDIYDTPDNKEMIEVNNTYLNIRRRNYTQISEENDQTLSKHTKNVLHGTLM